MQEIMLETAIQTFIQELIRESSDLLIKASDEIKQFYNQGLRDYFTKQKELYSHVKTVLQGNTPVYLYDIYFPINILQLGNWKEVKTDKISNLFVETNFITIIGNAGSGKSTLIKHLFLNSITEKYGIPILIELRYLNDYDDDIEEYINEVIFDNKLSQNTSILQRLLKRGKFVFFLDGFDELAGDVRELVTRQINNFINKNSSNRYILTSRPYANIEYLPLFHNYSLQPLNKSEIKEFVALQLRTEKELANKIIETIDTNPQRYIASYLSNPLLLSLFILTFQNNAEIPNKKYIFYRRVVQALFSEHDSKSKLGYIRERTSELTQEQLEIVLKRFSFLTFFEKKYDFELDYVLSKLEQIKSKYRGPHFDSQSLINDLKLAVALWVEDGNKIKFAHKSLQEYFVAVFIKDLNEEQKHTIYLKVIESLATMTEVDNFLSLCEEMDQVSYYKYFLIPAIQNAISNLNQGNEDDLINKLVNQSYSSLGYSEMSYYPHHYAGNTFPMLKIGEVTSAYKELHSYLSEKMDEICRSSTIATTGWAMGGYEQIPFGEAHYGVEMVYYLNLNPVPNDITAYLKETGMLDKIAVTKNNLHKLMRDKQRFITSSEKANDDLIDMIAN